CPPGATLFPYTTLFRSSEPQGEGNGQPPKPDIQTPGGGQLPPEGEPPTGGEGGAEAVLAKAKAFVDAYNSRNKEAMVATTCSDRSEEHTSELQSRENLV